MFEDFQQRDHIKLVRVKNQARYIHLVCLQTHDPTIRNGTEICYSPAISINRRDGKYTKGQIIQWGCSEPLSKA